MLKSKWTFLIFLNLAACGQAGFSPMMAPSPESNPLLPSPNNSLIQVSEPNYADGTSPAKVTLTIANKNNQPLPSVSMTLEVSGHQNTVVPCPPTDVNGQSVCWVYSTMPENKVVLAKGTINLSKATNFLTPPVVNALSGFVSGGEATRNPSSHKIIHSLGLLESPIVMKDVNQIRRIQSSIYGTLVE